MSLIQYLPSFAHYHVHKLYCRLVTDGQINADWIGSPSNTLLESIFITIPQAMNGDLVSLYLFMTLAAVTLGTQVTDKYMSYGNTMWGGDITNCVSTAVLSSETGRGESHRL